MTMTKQQQQRGWEIIHEGGSYGEMSDAEAGPQVMRFRVPGGWLYHVFADNTEDGGVDHVVFVPTTTLSVVER